MQSIRMTCQLNCTEFSIYIFTNFPQLLLILLLYLLLCLYQQFPHLRCVLFYICFDCVQDFLLYFCFISVFCRLFFPELKMELFVVIIVCVLQIETRNIKWNPWKSMNEKWASFCFCASFNVTFWSPSLSLSWLVVRKILINQLANLRILNEMSFIIVIAHFW